MSLIIRPEVDEAMTKGAPGEASQRLIRRLLDCQPLWRAFLYELRVLHRPGQIGRHAQPVQ